MSPQCPLRATIDEPLHDGDTLIITIHLPFSIDLPSRSVRAWGYDAWEVSRVRRTVIISDEEIEKGLIARDALSKLLGTFGLWVEETDLRDPYGRTSCRLWSKFDDGEWLDVASWMKANGHTRISAKAFRSRLP